MTSTRGLAAGGLSTAQMLRLSSGPLTLAVYDPTNHATLREWRAALTLVGIAWGAVSCGTAARAAWLATRA
jgi:uncharacterized membrane protein